MSMVWWLAYAVVTSGTVGVLLDMVLLLGDDERW